ncbi:MAG: aminotransferase class III-fold pyridoxal phosphate-dependent enzyme [Puniceicoccales bacterium]
MLHHLRALAQRLPHKIKEVRGLGYLVGVGLHEAPLPVVAQLREAGLLTAPAGSNTVRLIPPLTATTDELQEATRILEQVLSA